MAKYMKKWWLEHEFTNEDGCILKFTGWINTTHICKSKEDIVNEIKGSFWAELTSEGAYGRFVLDDPSVCEPDEGCYVFTVNAELIKRSKNYDEKNYPTNLFRSVAKTFSKFEARIEDCVSLDGTYVDVLEDGFTKINDNIKYFKNGYGLIEKDIYEKSCIISNIWNSMTDLKESAIFLSSRSVDSNFNITLNVILNNFVFNYIKFLVLSFEDLDKLSYKKILNASNLNKFINSTYENSEKYYNYMLDMDLKDPNKVCLESKNILSGDLSNKDIVEIISSLYDNAKKYFSENF